MMSRSGRAETRQSRKEDIKRVMHTIDKVFKWMPANQTPSKKVDQQKQARRLFEEAVMANDEDSNHSANGDPNDGAKRQTSMLTMEGKYLGDVNQDGKRHGQGEYVWPNGDRYTGQFANNLKNGNGILYFSNGDKRVGVWKDDKLHGPSTYYYSQGRIDEEVWMEDNKISEKRRK